MHRTAHTTFAMGISSLIPYLFSMKPLITFLIIFFGGMAGVIPDIDIKLGMKHRSWKGTHGPFFFILISLIFSFIIVLLALFFYPVTRDWTGLSFSDNGDLDLNESFFEITLIFFSIFLACSSHIFIDIITHTGISFGSHHIAGSMTSSSPVWNFVFASLGIIITMITCVSAIFVTYFSIMSDHLFTILLVFFVVLSIVIIFASIINEKRKRIPNIYCGKIYDIPLCIVDKKCININGNNVCFEKESYSNND